MKRNDQIEEQKIGNKTVLFDTDTFKFYELNETMGFIWELLKEETTKDAIVKKMIKEFDVSAERAEKDISKSIESLKKKKLLY